MEIKEILQNTFYILEEVKQLILKCNTQSKLKNFQEKYQEVETILQKIKNNLNQYPDISEKKELQIRIALFNTEAELLELKLKLNSL